MAQVLRYQTMTVGAQCLEILHVVVAVIAVFVVYVDLTLILRDEAASFALGRHDVQVPRSIPFRIVDIAAILVRGVAKHRVFLTMIARRRRATTRKNIARLSRPAHPLRPSLASTLSRRLHSLQTI